MSKLADKEVQRSPAAEGVPAGCSRDTMWLHLKPQGQCQPQRQVGFCSGSRSLGIRADVATTRHSARGASVQLPEQASASSSVNRSRDADASAIGVGVRKCVCSTVSDVTQALPPRTPGPQERGPPSTTPGSRLSVEVRRPPRGSWSILGARAASQPPSSFHPARRPLLAGHFTTLQCHLPLRLHSGLSGLR